MKYVIVYIVVVIISGLTGLWNGTDVSAVREDAMLMLFPIVCFILCCKVLNKWESIRRMLVVVYIGCVLKATILAIYFFGGKGVPVIFGDKELRVTTYDPADLLAFVTIVLLAILLAIKRKVSGVKLHIMMAGALPMIIVVIMSYRRAIWIGSVVSTAMLVYYAVSRNRLNRIIVAAAIIVVIGLSYVLIVVNNEVDVENKLVNLSVRVASIFDSSNLSNRHHILEAKQTMKDILASPIFGLGLGSRHEPVPGWLVGWEEEKQPLNIVHNTFLYFWMKMGISGLILFVWMGLQYVKIVNRYHSIERYGIRGTVVSGIGASSGLWLILALVSPFPVYYQRSFLVALFAAIVVMISRLERRRQQISD